MKRIVFLWSCLLVTMSTCAFGQAKGELIAPVLINDVDRVAVARHPVTPFLESSSMILIDLDLTKADVPQTLAWLGTLTGSPEMAQSAAPISGFVDSLKAAGAEHMYLIASPRSILDGGPYALLPSKNPEALGAQLSQFVGTFPAEPAQKVHVGKDFVLAGSAKAIDRITARKGAERPDLVLPLLADGRLNHLAVVSLPKEAKEELAATWPEQMSIPGLPIEVSPRQIVQDVQQVIVSIDLPPQPSTDIRIESIDADAAARTHLLVTQALDLAGELKSKVQVVADGQTVRAKASAEALVELALAITAPARESARKMMKANSMKQVALAFHNYTDANRHFPPRQLADPQGKPLWSWIATLLPYIEQQALYESVKLDQPWDSEANKVFSSVLIEIFNADQALLNKTTLRAPVFPGSLWDANGAPEMTFRDVKDGTSNTILFVDAPVEAAIEWANPQPWILSESDPMKDLFGNRDEVTVAWMDGSVRVLKRDEMTNDKLKAMLTIAGGEVFEH